MRLAVIARATSLIFVLSVLGVLGVLPASAASGVGVVEVSDDGVSFSRTYPGVIFDDIQRLVPDDSQSDTIYVRNTGTAAGYLRITLRDVSYTDSDYGNALSVTTSVPGSNDGAHLISSAAPCRVTTEGTLIHPGQTVPVTASLALGNLTGTAGQGATASLALHITLSDTTPGTLPPTECDSSGTTVPVTPNTPSAPTTPGDSTTNPFNGGLAIPTPSPSPSPATSETGTDNSVSPNFPVGFTLDPNTWRLYEEYLVLILVIAAMLGAGISWFWGRRSRKEDENV